MLPLTAALLALAPRLDAELRKYGDQVLAVVDKKSDGSKSADAPYCRESTRREETLIMWCWG